MAQNSYPSIEAAFAGIGGEATTAFLEHLDGGTPAAYLTDWLKRAGHPVSTTVLKDFRSTRRSNA